MTWVMRAAHPGKGPNSELDWFNNNVRESSSENCL